MGGPRLKKNAAQIHQEVAREVNALIARIFTERRKTGHIDLEAVEMLVRTAMHKAGAGRSDPVAAIRRPGTRAAKSSLFLWP